MDVPSAESQAGQTRLNGWKEIAAHLGKGVRTVQRWEREYGLPVRRLGREGGEIVFAFTDEIDRWSAEWGPRRQADEDSEAAPVPAASGAAVEPRSRRTALAAVATLVIVISIGLWFALWPAAASRIGVAKVEGRMLVAYGHDRERLWTYALEFEPDRTYSRIYSPQHGMNKITVADLENDGSDEVMLLTSSVGVRGPQGFRVFNADGSVRFAIEPRDTVTFGAEEYVGPWAAYRLFVTDNPDGTRSIWTAFVHSLWFPTLLLEVDASGRIKSKYWSNGYIENVTVANRAGRPRVFIGGTNNETRGASLAVFDHGQVRGSAPAVRERYQCRTCEHGGPDHFLVFPRQCLATAMDGQAAVAEIRVDEAGNVFVLSGEGHRQNRDGDFPAGVWYTINPEFTAAAMRFTQGIHVAHAQMERAGLISHAFSESTDPIDRAAFLKWNGAAFVTTSVPAPNAR
jgi:hypothetical protein